MTITRRMFFVSAGSAAGLAAAAAPPPVAVGGASSPGGGASWLFFNRAEAAFIRAAVDRLIPPDALGPGAVQAGVPEFIDRQLAGAWGAGERFYRSGPWQAGAPTQGYQLPYTPAELMRTGLRAVAADLVRAQLPAFETLDGDAQDRYLTQLQNGQRELGELPAAVFFEALLALTVEGYFGDPAYGGNRGMAAWRMIGFPGAHAAYHDLVDRHGITYTGAPQSIADAAPSDHHPPGPR